MILQDTDGGSCGSHSLSTTVVDGRGTGKEEEEKKERKRRRRRRRRKGKREGER